MTERLKMTRGSGNVFRDLGFPPEEAQNLLHAGMRVERSVKKAA